MFSMKNKGDSLGMHPIKSVLYSESQEKYRSHPISENFTLLETLVLGDWLSKAEIINQKMVASVL